MRTIILSVCVLAVLFVASCRSTPAPTSTANPTSPLPTSVAPQSLPTATLGASPGPTSLPAPAASGIRLTATMGPTCPGPERPGQVCSQPYEGLFSVADGSGAEVARLTTDWDGTAAIDLPPGAYTVTPKIEGRFPVGVPTAVTVVSGQYIEVSVELDTGIR